VRLALDEWNFWYGPFEYGELGTRYFLQDGLGAAAALHEMFRNSDLFFMANYAQTVNVLGAIKTTKTAAALEATGQVLKLYRNQFGTIPMEIAQQPQNLDVSAAWTEDESAITISIINLEKTANRVTLDTSGSIAFKESARRWDIGGTDYEAYNDPGKPALVTIKQSEQTISKNTLEVPPMSIVLYRLETSGRPRRSSS